MLSVVRHRCELIPSQYDEPYRVTRSMLLALAWSLFALSGGLWYGRMPTGKVLIVFAGVTRLVRTYVGSWLVPFMTNVVRDHKCRDWDDVPRSVLVTIVYKVFYGLQDIIDVLMVISFDWKVYAVLIFCDVAASTVSTIQFVRGKASLYT